MSFKRMLIVAPMMLLLAACASSFNADVARFHRLPQPTGQTIKIVPQNPDKEGSLEFQTYAGMMAPELERLGYNVVAPQANSDLVARVDYEVDDGNTVVKSYPSSSLRYGYGYGYYRPWFDPWYGYAGYENNIRSYILYPRRLSLQIVRGDLTPEDDGWMLYEGHAASDGQNNRLPEVMPLLIKALFTNFPGESGRTDEVKIELD